MSRALSSLGRLDGQARRLDITMELTLSQVHLYSSRGPADTLCVPSLFYQAFLALLLPPFLVRSTRLAISGLLTHFLQASPGLSKHLANTPLLDAVLTSLQLDTSTTVFQLQVTILQVTLTGAPAALAEK